MTRSLTRHLGLRLLALVISGVILAPKVIHAYDITRNDNVRPFHHKASGFAETNALIPFFVRLFASLPCMSSASHRAPSRIHADTNNDPAIGDRMVEVGSRI
jgi:hypothetical protein